MTFALCHIKGEPQTLIKIVVCTMHDFGIGLLWAQVTHVSRLIMMVTEVVTCVSYLQGNESQHNLDCTLTTTIWNQHSKRQTSGKISKRVAAPRDSKVLPRWRFLTPLDGNKYYYQVLLLNVPFRYEGKLISDPNASGTFKEECFLRNLVRQFADQ